MTTQHPSWPIVWIGAAADVDVDRIGVKAWYLEQLEHAGFPTAPAFCVEAEAYLQSIASSRVEHRLQTIWETAATAKPHEIGMLSRKARHLISEIEFGRGIHQDLEAHLSELFARSPAIPPLP